MESIVGGYCQHVITRAVTAQAQLLQCTGTMSGNNTLDELSVTGGGQASSQQQAAAMVPTAPLHYAHEEMVVPVVKCAANPHTQLALNLCAVQRLNTCMRCYGDYDGTL